MFACQAIHSSAEPGSLMIRIDTHLRDELIAAEPEIYYLTPHYAPYPAVVVRLARVSRGGLGKALALAALFVGSSGRAKARGGQVQRKKKVSRSRGSARRK